MQFELILLFQETICDDHFLLQRLQYFLKYNYHKNKKLTVIMININNNNPLVISTNKYSSIKAFKIFTVSLRPRQAIRSFKKNSGIISFNLKQQNEITSKLFKNIIKYTLVLTNVQQKYLNLIYLLRISVVELQKFSPLKRRQQQHLWHSFFVRQDVCLHPSELNTSQSLESMHPL